MSFTATLFDSILDWSCKRTSSVQSSIKKHLDILWNRVYTVVVEVVIDYSSGGAIHRYPSKRGGHAGKIL